VPSSYFCSVTVGLPSITSTLVGWYCSAEVSQGGSFCSRSIVIGTYLFASSSAAASPGSPVFWSSTPEGLTSSESLTLVSGPSDGAAATAEAAVRRTRSAAARSAAASERSRFTGATYPF